MFFKSNGSNPSHNTLLEHIDGLYSYALALSRNCGDAEDLVQETYVHALAAVGRLRIDSNIKGWLFTILRNIWLNRLRQPRVALQMTGADIDQYFANIPTNTFKDPHFLPVSKMDVRQAIQHLPVKAREIILLREFEELSYCEIASVLGCPIGTVMSRIARARARLRVLLSIRVKR
jgi:RNA polymerase sigma-70 factor, ECF subfamily